MSKTSRSPFGSNQDVLGAVGAAPSTTKTFINPPQVNTMLPSNKHTSLYDAIAIERLRQARISFNATLIGTVAAVGFGVCAALSGNAALGIATATLVGGGGSLRCAQLNRETNDRLDQLIGTEQQHKG